MKLSKKVLALCVAAVTAFSFTACGNNNGAETGNNDSAALSGTLKMAGSTSMEKLANALSESFMEKNSGVTVTAEFIGSSAGIEALTGGSADIGNSSRALKDS